MAAVLVPVLGLVVLELALRFVGYGYETAYFIRHAAAPGKLVENQRFPWRFFPPTLARHPTPVVLSPAKPEGVYRIFVLGESAAEGDPAPEFGCSRILQVLLQARYPGVRFEVVNVAFTAISSHVILPIARDCARLEGDLWLVYMGNNEVIGPYGAGTVFNQQTLPLPVIRAGLALKQTRLGQLADAVARGFRHSEDATKGWGGMSMFVGQRVRREDPRLAGVYRNFERNLTDIVRLGLDSGAQVVLSTMVANLRDCPPFASLHPASLTPEQSTAWDQAYQAGIAAEAAGDPARAVRDYERAAAIDGGFADLRFRWARCHLALGANAEAGRQFEQARDLDALRFRADSQLNNLIRQTAAQWSGLGVKLVDAERVFSEQTSDGIPGAEWLYEHVHFRFAGNYLLARLFAGQVAQMLPPALASRVAPDGGWLPEAECAARLGYTANLQYEIGDLVRQRLEEAVYQGQLEHAERQRRLQEQLSEQRAQNKPASRQRAVGLCQQAVAGAPDDWMLRAVLARSLAGVDDFVGAANEWQRVALLVPHDATPWFELGQLSQQQGRLDEAGAHFRRAIEVNPDHAKSHEALGMVCAEKGQVNEALAHLRAAVRADPTRNKAAEYLARVSAGPARKRRRRRIGAAVGSRACALKRRCGPL